MLIQSCIKYIHCAIELEIFYRSAVKCVALCIYWRNMLSQISSLLSFCCLGILFLSVWTPTVASCIIRYVFISVSANSKVMEFPIGCKTLCLVSERHLKKLYKFAACDQSYLYRKILVSNCSFSFLQVRIAYFYLRNLALARSNDIGNKKSLIC